MFKLKLQRTKLYSSVQLCCMHSCILEKTYTALSRNMLRIDLNSFIKLVTVLRTPIGNAYDDLVRYRSS
jgi:hypothetical protein